MVENCDSPKIVKIPYTKCRFLVILRPFSPMYIFLFQDGGGCFLLVHSKRRFLRKRWALTCPKQVIQFPAKLLILAIFGYLVPHSKSIFSMYRQTFKKFLVVYLEKVDRIIGVNFELSVSSGLRGGSRFAFRQFPKTVTLASCNFVGRPIVACYACSIICFHFSQYWVFDWW